MPLAAAWLSMGRALQRELKCAAVRLWQRLLMPLLRKLLMLALVLQIQAIAVTQQRPQRTARPLPSASSASCKRW